MVAEFWNGWFDHWGERHHIRDAESVASVLGGIVADGGSVSIYMAHGGTNFGLWAGANERDGVLQPTVTSYDSDAPVAEDGTLTAKFYAIREVLGARGPVRTPARMPALPPARVPLVHRADLLAGLRAVPASGSTGPRPASFERLGLDAGAVLYTARPRIPAGEHRLLLSDVRDRATVFVDGTLLGAGTSLPIRGTGDVVRLDVLVENLGRVNYGPGIGGHKGLLGPVLVDRRIVQGWESTPVALQDWSTVELAAALAAGPPATDAGFATATVHIGAPADTFLALPGSGRGLVWVNGFLLGRYWEIGPQVTLYCPAPLLHAGDNTVTVLELDHLGGVLELRDRHELGQPEEYIEEFI